MKITIHQANYFPYPGFFQKVSLSDVYVVLDKAQFQFDTTNRNKIITPDGSWTRISVPIKKGQKFFEIRNVEINNDLAWAEENWNLIHKSYKASPFFDLYKVFLDSLYKKRWNLLFDLNLQILKKVFDWLDIKTEIILESELDVTGTSSKRLLNICKKLGADTYISGIGGKTYLDEKLFEKNKIILKYQNYNPIRYLQHMSESFIPNLSIIDLLANVGSESRKLLKESN